MAKDNVWIDLDSGTVLNGPVVEVPASIITDDMSDSEVIAAAREYLKWL